MKPRITEHGIEIQTFEEIFEELAEGYKEIYGQDIDLSAESPDGQRIGIEARIILDLQQLAVKVYNSLDPDFDDGLMRSAKLSGIFLKPATASQWDLKITVARDLTLKKGYTVKDELEQEWWLTSDVSLTLGENTVTFIAKEVGRVEGVQGSEITPVTVVLGVTDIAAMVSSLTGRDEEKPTELRQSRERSLQNPAYSVMGALYARLARLDGVTDLNVAENDNEFTDPVTNIPPKSIWVIVEGGRVADIIEVIVKQKTAGANTIGAIESTYLENVVKPDGSVFPLIHKVRFDRPEYVDLHITLEAKAKVPGTPIDGELIKNRLAERKFKINQSIQASELYDDALKASDDFIITDIKISIDGEHWTDELITPAINERLIIKADNVTVTV